MIIPFAQKKMVERFVNNKVVTLSLIGTTAGTACKKKQRIAS